jgi:hypothetical protein
MTTWMVGDLVYLVPTLQTAPRVAYQQPQVRIVSLVSTRVEVELEGGSRLWTSLRNLAKRPLNPEPTKPKPLPAVKSLTLAGNEHESTLW